MKEKQIFYVIIIILVVVVLCFIYEELSKQNMENPPNYKAYGVDRNSVGGQHKCVPTEPLYEGGHDSVISPDSLSLNLKSINNQRIHDEYKVEIDSVAVADSSDFNASTEIIETEIDILNIIKADSIGTNENESFVEVNNIKRKDRPEFMQGLYVTAYRAANRNFDDFLLRAKEAGINTIVFDVKEMQGFVYFSIRNHPQLEYTYAEPILNINRIVEKIHANGLYAVARAVQFYNITTATRHPDLQPRNTDGGFWQERAGTPTWLDSSHPLVQAELLKIIDIIASSNVDEIQLDYVRFPTEGRLSNAVFYFETEDKERLALDSLYVKREKRDIIRDYVRDVREVVDRHNVRLSADIFAIVAWQREADIRNTGQDIAYMTPYLHHLHPMIYSSHFSDGFNFNAEDIVNKPYPIVRRGLEMTIRKTDPSCKVIPYLQAFGWRVNYHKGYIFDQLNAAVDSGSDGYILWNAGGNYNTSLPWIKEWNAELRIMN